MGIAKFCVCGRDLIDTGPMTVHDFQMNFDNVEDVDPNSGPPALLTASLRTAALYGVNWVASRRHAGLSLIFGHLAAFLLMDRRDSASKNSLKVRYED